MSHRICPFWMGYLLLCPFRGFGQNPHKILAPYVGSGMTVLEIGPGMGFFTLPMARIVGLSGKIVCVVRGSAPTLDSPRRIGSIGGAVAFKVADGCQRLWREYHH